MNLHFVRPTLLAVATAVALAGCSAATNPTPQDSAAFNDADVMFATMMIPHHEQAIEMSKVVQGVKGIDNQVADLAATITSAQAPEIAQLKGWLAEWGASAPEHMDHGDSMMTADDMTALKAAPADEVADLFLTQMVEHHEGAIEMARTEIAEGRHSGAVAMANGIVESQSGEIDHMKKLLGVAPGAGGALLDAHGLTGMDAVQIIDKLDAMPVGDRPTDLMASIRPQTLMLSDPESGEKVDVPMPADQVYVSVAPYRQQTHDCHFHSLTTCKGELGNTAAHVKLTTTDGRVIIDEDRTTFDNGFIGLWVPRGLEADLVVTVDGQQATAKVSTKSPEDATCVTTLKLA